MTTLTGIGAMGTAAFASAGFSWPFLGSVLAWGLVAALVGSGLGLLREIAGWRPPFFVRPSLRGERPTVSPRQLDMCHRPAA